MMPSPSIIADIALDAITVLNPRQRSRRARRQLSDSISKIGLKRPITVANRSQGGFHLVCGQGRLEACRALGAATIAAIVIEAPPTDCIIMSLVENIIRAQRSSWQGIDELVALRGRGHSCAEIAVAIGRESTVVEAMFDLLDQGERRQLGALEKRALGSLISAETASANGGIARGAFPKASRRNAVSDRKIGASRHVIAQRETIDESGRDRGPSQQTRRHPDKADRLARAASAERSRQQHRIQQAKQAEDHVVSMRHALESLVVDPTLIGLLRSESMQHVPRALLDQFSRRREPG